MTEPTRTAFALPEVRTTFAGASSVPDVSVYRRNRIPFDADGDIADVLRRPPDIAIEILSPGQSRNRSIGRCRWYAGHGLETALLVDPKRRSVHAFRADGTTAEWRGADRIALGTVAPNFALTVGGLFAFLRVHHPAD